MSSFKWKSTVKATLTVQAKDPATEIDVLDGKLRAHRRSCFGQTTELLAPGVYKVRFRVGVCFTETLVALQPGESRRIVQSDDVPLSSAAPLPGCINFDEKHFEAALQICNGQSTTFAGGGSGSQLMLFFRDCEPDRSLNPAEGLTLHDLRGSQLVDVSEVGVREAKRGWCGVLLELPPGGYLLRTTPRNGPYRQRIITTHAGWQTQAYFVCTEHSANPTDGRANLADMAILIVRRQALIDLGDERWRWTEKTLRAVEQPRSVVDAEALANLTHDVEHNPMLGIYAALLHFRDEASDLTKIATLLTISLGSSIENSLDGLPDRQAILAALRMKGEQGEEYSSLSSKPMEIPPLLSESWNLLVQARLWNKTIRRDSLLGRTWSTSSEGAWLVLGETPDKAQPVEVATQPMTFDQFAHRCDFLYTQLADCAQLARRVESADLSRLEQRVAHAVFPATHPNLSELSAVSVTFSKLLATSRRLSVDRLYIDLNLPLPTISSAVEGLLDKLNLPTWILDLRGLISSGELQRVLRPSHRPCTRVLPFEDFCQEVITRAIKSGARYRGKTTRDLVGWLIGIARNVILQELQRSRKDRAKPLPPDYATIDYSSDDPAEAASKQEKLRWMGKTLERISIEERDWLLQRFEEGKAWADIAENSGLTPDSLRMRVMRLIARLRDLRTDQA